MSNVVTRDVPAFVLFLIALVALVVLVYVNEHSDAWLVLAGAGGCGLVFGGCTYRLRWLTGSGAIAGGLLAASLVGFGGWAWAVPAFAFFVLSSALSKVGAQRKQEAAALSGKDSVRDVGQVVANGGVGWGLLLVYAVYPLPVLYWGFLGAFAAAAADTWGTEIGTLSRGQPRIITTGRRVPRGTSGAVSLVGTLGALLGAAVIGGSAWLVAPEVIDQLGKGHAAAAVVLGGFLASLVDSLAGATVQARFRDPRTGGETERTGTATTSFQHIRGWRWLDNDWVNGLCTTAGAIFAIAYVWLAS